jgi:drug/metabolite transporter (DMT)-like permease
MKSAKQKQFTGALYCISAAAIWGLSFVAQSIGRGVGTFTFNCLRMLLGAAVLVPVIILRRKKKISPPVEDRTLANRKLLLGGILAGITMFFGNNLQQEAFNYIEDVGKVGFITALYTVIVPLMNFLFFKKRVGINVIAGVAFSLAGLYLLCSGEGGFVLEKGDILTILCAFAFASQILVIDKFTDYTDAVEISSLQFFVCGVLSGICMFIFEKPTPELIMQKQNIIPILYAGIMSCGVAFTFQTFGQKSTEPAVASILLCLESAFSVVFGWIILHQHLGRRALIGCAVMLVAVIFTQIQFPSIGNKNEKGVAQ